MAKETLPGGPGEGKGLHGKMNDVAKTTQGQIVKVAEDDTEKTEGAVFEKINLLSGIDEEKLAELQKADLVLVYRDNNKYRDMSSSLENLVENKYGKKVYCVSIPQGTEDISDSEMELLKRILNTCHCMTDNTVSKWTGIKCPKFEEDFYTYEDTKRFLGITEKLEKKFEEEGIDTVYVYVSGLKNYGLVLYTCYDHGSMCQREDGSIFYESRELSGRDDVETKLEDDKKLENMKRFWKSMFPNLNVEFIENFHVDANDKKRGLDFSRYESEGIILRSGGRPITYEKMKMLRPDFDVDYYIGKDSNLSGLKSEGAVLIADRHAIPYLRSFGGKKIAYAGNAFEPEGGIEDFLDEEDANYVGNAGEAIAETIMLDAFGSGNKPEK